MDIKNIAITSISLTVLVAILFIIGFNTVKYLQGGYKEANTPVADAPKVELEQKNSDKNIADNGPDSEGIDANTGAVMGTKTDTKKPTEDTYGISDNVKSTTKTPTLPKTGTNSTGFSSEDSEDENTSTTSKPITLRSVDLTISSPKVEEVDDNYIRFDYTFNLSQNAKTYLTKTGVTYIIDAENCRDYFNDNEYIFEKSYRKGTLPTSFSVELPEEALDSDNDYLEKATFEIEANGKTVITGTTYVPSCR